MENHGDRRMSAQRPGGRTSWQSTVAIVVSLVTHLILLVVLYEFGLAYLTDSDGRHALITNLATENELPEPGDRLEFAVSSPYPAAIDESSAADLPAPAPGELSRRLDSVAPSTPTVIAINRRNTAGAILTDTAATVVVPPSDIGESAGRLEPSTDGSVSAIASLRRSEVPRIVRGGHSSESHAVATVSTSDRPRRELRLAEPLSGPEFAFDTTSIIFEPALDGDGIAPGPAPDSSLPDRLASRDDGVIRLTPPGHANRRIATARISIAPVRTPSAAYIHRGRRQSSPPDADRNRVSAKTDAAIEMGLQYLASIQLADGHWEFQYLGAGASRQETERIAVRANAAATGLALLAFLGAGYDHFGDRYEQNVQAGLDYLTHIQSSAGELFPERDVPSGQSARFYGHGIATLALGEAYGMTGDPELQRPAQSAIDFLVATQHPQFGGWRYVPGTNADLSVSGWQLTALKSGELAGLSVRADTYARLRTLVEQCREQSADRARFCYNPWASPTDPLTRHGRQPSTVMTSVGLLMQLHLGVPPTDERWQLGADHLLANLAQLGDAANPAITGTIGNPQRDTYYWYYATQVTYRRGGKHWNEWNERLRPLLTDSQVTDGPLAGSWDAYQPVPDKWANYGGRLYVTAMNLLSLEVEHRQLPLDAPSLPRIADRP